LSAAALLLGNSVNAFLGGPPDTSDSTIIFKSVDYAIDLPCGSCIAGGWNFCWKSDETGLIVTDDQYPKNTGLYADTNLLCC